MNLIQGSGGGKSGGGEARTPVEAPDSLRTKSYVNVLDLLGAGEWLGLANGMQSVFLDGVPVQNSDGSFNHNGVTFDFRTGAMSQARIPKAVGVESVTSVGVEVKANSPVERIVSNSETDVVRVALHFPQMTTQNTANGDLTGSSVQYKIEYKPNGGSWIPALVGTERQSVSAAGFTASEGAFLGLAGELPYSVITEYLGQNGTHESTRKRWYAARVQVYLTENGAERLVQTKDFASYTQSRVSSSAVQQGQFSFEVYATTTPGTTCSWRYTITPLETGWTTAATISTRYSQKQIASSNGTVSGKTTSGYTRTHSIRLSGAAPWIVRVTRITPDSTSSTVVNKFYFESYTEVIEEKLRYPGCVLAYLAVDAEQFSSIPTRGYDCYMKIIQVPTNYDPLTRKYTGVWDGTFKMAWCDNPAWVFRDIVLDPENGTGDRITEDMLDKWELYKIAQYCDELVPDGLGGSEPRFTCNIYIQERRDAFSVIRDLASIFRGMTYWGAGAIIAVQDAPQQPAYQFNGSNVIDGQFNYTSSSRNARHNVALVSWNDPADLYRAKTEYVADEAAISRMGFVNETQITAIGCTSRGQAVRAGRWLLYTEQFETETVTFITGLEGNVPRPGDVILIADEFRSGERRGGRVSAATATTLTMDAPLPFVGATSYSVSVITPAGTVETKPLVAGQSGNLTTVSITTPWSNRPEPEATFIISSSDLEPEQYRVISVTEKNPAQFEITALLHFPSKYAYVEDGEALVVPDTSNTTAGPPAAADSISVSEYLYVTGIQVEVGISVSWTPVVLASSYNFSYKRDDENWVSVGGVNTPGFEIRNAKEGNYQFKVEAINALGVKGAAASETYTVVGKSAPPSNVQGFVVTRAGAILKFAWKAVPDLDLDYYEIRKGAIWSTAPVIARVRATTFEFDSPRGGDFMIKAVDTLGNESLYETYTLVPDFSSINAVLSVDQQVQDWPGVCSNSIVISGERPLQWADMVTWGDPVTWGTMVTTGGVLLNGSTPWASYTLPWASYNVPWVFLDAKSTGSYTTDAIDLGYIASALLDIESQVEIISAPGVTGGGEDFVAAFFEMSTSEDNVTWTDFTTFSTGEHKFRYLKARANLATADTNFLPYLTKFIIKIDVPDRVLHFEDVAVPLAGMDLVFDPPFVGVKTVQVTLQSAVSSDVFTVTNKSETGVTIKCFNSSGAAKVGLVDVDVFGYGEKT